MAFQFLKITLPQSATDAQLSLGFQRVASISDTAASQEDAAQKTFETLQELLIGWGIGSSEWRDLMRVCAFYGYPLVEGDDQFRESMIKVSDHVCRSMRRLVEMLCVLQSICLQRLANSLQHAVRQLNRQQSQATCDDTEILFLENQQLQEKIKCFDLQVDQLKAELQESCRMSDLIKERDTRMALEAEIKQLLKRCTSAEAKAFEQSVEIAQLQSKIESNNLKLSVPLVDESFESSILQQLNFEEFTVFTPNEKHTPTEKKGYLRKIPSLKNLLSRKK